MIELIFRTKQQFLATADLDGLLAIRKAGFHICRNVGAFTDHEQYVDLSPLVVQTMWHQVAALPVETWRYDELRSIWRAHYILAEPGQYHPDTARDNRAAICTPRSDPTKNRWYLQLALNYSDTQHYLGAAALRLIEWIMDHEDRA